MMALVNIRGHAFRVAGPHGDVTVYDQLGRPLTSGLRDLDAAQAWCDRRARNMGEAPERPRETIAPTGRDRRTGY